ncbi:hypothetical protein [Salipiger mangrovisoli]|uniref:hypothetical protein n=1 Tax=Salipiger mangrovisoli TaxID=2865933 RepID=UPI001F11C9F4|nr:hypothetical protein [Salipiger mangrovisoli]
MKNHAHGREQVDWRNQKGERTFHDPDRRLPSHRPPRLADPTTSPDTMPSVDLNKAVMQRAEHFGLDVALSMIKLRGHNGPSEYRVQNLERFTMMSGSRRSQAVSSASLPAPC